MPTYDKPEARHYGRAERTIPVPDGMRHTRGKGEIIVGCVYDPSKIPGAKLDKELDAELNSVWDTACRQRDLTIDGGGAGFSPWEAVARMEARYPGHVLPHPGLALPPDLKYPRWYPTEEEVAKIEASDVSKTKGAYIHETGDWAVDGEGV